MLGVPAEDALAARGVSVRVVTRRENVAWTLEIEISRPSGTQSRQLLDESCAALQRTAFLIIVVAADPRQEGDSVAETSRAEPEPNPEEGQPSQVPPPRPPDISPRFRSNGDVMPTVTTTTHTQAGVRTRK